LLTFWQQPPHRDHVGNPCPVPLARPACTKAAFTTVYGIKARLQRLDGTISGIHAARGRRAEPPLLATGYSQFGNRISFLLTATNISQPYSSCLGNTHLSPVRFARALSCPGSAHRPVRAIRAGGGQSLTNAPGAPWRGGSAPRQKPRPHALRSRSVAKLVAIIQCIICSFATIS